MDRKMLIRTQTGDCLLCQDAPCTAACPEGLPVDLSPDLCVGTGGGEPL